MVSGRHGPYWLDGERIVTTVSDRGRSHPARLHHRPEDRRAARAPSAVDGDITTHTLAVAGPTGRSPRLRHRSACARWSSTPDRRTPTPRRGPAARRLGSRWQDRFEMPEMRLVEAPGRGRPDRDLDRLAASGRRPRPPDGRRCPRRTARGVGTAPRIWRSSCWSPRAIAWSCPTSGARPRTAEPGSAPQLGDWGGVDAADVHAALDHVIDARPRRPRAARASWA